MAATSAVCSAIAIAKLSSSRTAWSGDVSHVAVKCGGGSRSDRVAVKCRAETVEKAEIGDEEASGMSRRLAIALLAGAAVVGGRVNPAQAAYGEAANVFGAAKPQSGFKTFSGQGFEVKLPSKWNPSKEVEFPGQVLRYEDNFDATNNLSVSILISEKGSIQDYGSPEELLKSLSYLLGRQSYSGLTNSEGGFTDNRVSKATVLESKVSEVKGKTYFTVSVLTQTADGDEGGKHHLIVATINGGKLYVLKVQAGDKRWFKGAKKIVEGTINSFNVI